MYLNIQITDEELIWLEQTKNENAYEFRADIYFSIGERYFVIDVTGLRMVGWENRDIVYN